VGLNSLKSLNLTNNNNNKNNNNKNNGLGRGIALRAIPRWLAGQSRGSMRTRMRRRRGSIWGLSRDGIHDIGPLCTRVQGKDDLGSLGHN
jgi:hypothetical protein